jgi:hypothetical protein
VYSLMHIGWVEDESGGGHHAQMAVLTKPNGWTGKAYMALVKPFRYALIYPMLLRAIERKWRRGAHADGQLPAQARRVAVTDPIATNSRYDYADAFELQLEDTDRLTPEEWVRAGVDATPSWIKRIAGSPDGLASVVAVESTPEVVVFEDSDPLMDTVIVGRNLGPGHRMLTTVLRYRRPLLAPAVWGLVSIVHRRTAPKLVAGGPVKQPSGASL